MPGQGTPNPANTQGNETPNPQAPDYPDYPPVNTRRD